MGNRKIGWEAGALLEGLRLAPLVRRDRPRLFFNAETWPAIAARAHGLLQDRFERWQREAAGYAVPPAEAFRGNEWTQTMRMAFVTRITGGPAVREKTQDLLRSTLNWLLSRAQIRMRCFPGIAVAAGLDWVWDSVPADERIDLAHDLLQYVHAMYVEDRLQGRLQNSPAYMQQSAAA